MKEESALYVIAALLLIILIGVLVPIAGDMHSVPQKIWSSWESVQQYFASGYEWLKNIVRSKSADATILYVTAGLVAFALLLVLWRLIHKRRKSQTFKVETDTKAKPVKTARTVKAGEPAGPVETVSAKVTTETEEPEAQTETPDSEPNVEIEVEVEPEPTLETKPKARYAGKRIYRVHVIRKRMSSFFSRVGKSIFDFITGMLELILNFAHVVIALLYALILVVVFGGVIYFSKDWIEKNVGPALLELKPPADFQGLWGGLMFFAVLLATITAISLLLVLAFSVLARAFAKVVALGSAPEPKRIGRVLAYVVYSLALIMTVVVFSKTAAVVTALGLFIVAPIVAALVRLTLEEEEAQ